MKILFTALFFFAFSTGCFAQSGNDTIYWAPCYELKFEDFQGKPDSNKIDLANSRIGIWYTYIVTNGKLQFDVICYFLKGISWAKYNMNALMLHEQTHFDIAKLFALKFEKRLKEYKLTPNVGNDIKGIYDSIVAERLAMDNLYDKIEKENPTTDIPQKKFESSIKKQLIPCKKKRMKPVKKH